MKHIGADLHSKSITFATLNEKGKVLDVSTIATSEKLVHDYLKAIKGEKRLTFEEGPLAEWMLNITHDKADKVIVCNPRSNPTIYKGNSNDRVDAKNLAELLRLDSLKEVVHPLSLHRQEFREVVILYSKIVKDITRTKNRLKSAFRMKAVKCAGNKVYNEENQKDWLEKISGNKVTKKVVSIYWEQLKHLETQKQVVYDEIKRRAKRFKEIGEFLEVPGVGLITASTFSAYIFNPLRFANKSKLWSYCSLSLIENDSGMNPNPARERIRRRKVLRRLTNNGNRRLKSVLKSSAQVACHTCKDNEMKRKYLALNERGLDYSSAILSISRMLASKLWGIWKRIERENNKIIE